MTLTSQDLLSLKAVISHPPPVSANISSDLTDIYPGIICSLVLMFQCLQQVLFSIFFVFQSQVSLS